MDFIIPTTDAGLLTRADAVAIAHAGSLIGPDTVGVVFLGALARGYFDRDADIDLAVFRRTGAQTGISCRRVEGFEVQCFEMDYDRELRETWDLSKRWAYSAHRIFHDPEGLVTQLIAAKVPLRPGERRRALMSGMALSEWYGNRLPDLWLRRGSLLDAHAVINEGIDQFLAALFALNNELPADRKWRTYCAGRLPVLPSGFREKLSQALVLRDVSREELERRRRAFMDMWREMLPRVEEELGMEFEEFKDLV